MRFFAIKLTRLAALLAAFLLLSSFQVDYDLLPPPKDAVLAPALATVPLTPPLQSGKITDRFSYRLDPFTEQVDFHYGLDIAAERKTEIHAVQKGVVVRAATQQSYGKYILIDHYNGFFSLYAHCEELLVQPGDEVKAGKVIALSGSSGRATGPHLHLELRLDGRRIDPESFFDCYD